MRSSESTSEVKGGVESNECAHQLRLYDNVSSSMSDEKANGTDTQEIGTLCLGNRLQSPRLSRRRPEDSHLPPAPSPPIASQLLYGHLIKSDTTATATNESERNNISLDSSTECNDINKPPPPVAPKPPIQFSPKNSDLSDCQQRKFS